VKVTTKNARLLVEGVGTIIRHSDPEQTYANGSGSYLLNQLNSKVEKMVESNDPLSLLVNKLNGGYIVSLVSKNTDHFGTGLVRSEILYPPPAKTSPIVHALDTMKSLLETVGLHATYEKKSNNLAYKDKTAKILGLSTT
jgi:hypothetical protein